MSIPTEQQEISPPPPPPVETGQQQQQEAEQSQPGHGTSVGPVIAVLFVITLLGVIAGMIGRLCAGRGIFGHWEYDFEGWVERKCSSCIDGHVDPVPVRRIHIPFPDPVEEHRPEEDEGEATQEGKQEEEEEEEGEEQEAEEAGQSQQQKPQEQETEKPKEQQPPQKRPQASTGATSSDS